jgi:hypothetical protein
MQPDNVIRWRSVMDRIPAAVFVRPSQDVSFFGLGFLAITPSSFDRKYQSSCFQAGVASE